MRAAILHHPTSPTDEEIDLDLSPTTPTTPNTNPFASGAQTPTGHDPTLPAHFSLPPADGGKDAWLVLLACFILEALVWGFPFAYPVFNDYYHTQPQFAGQTSAIAAIGTTQTGIMYFGAPVVYGVLRRWPRLRKPACVAGFVVLEAGLVAASFAQTIPGLLGTQGVLFAVGGCVHYFPAFLYLDEWFFARKGLAYGVVWAGTGVAGVALPLTLQWILRTWGHQTALRTWAVVSLILTPPAVFCLKGRLPVQHAPRGPQRVETGFLKSRAFWILQMGNVVQGLGYFMPTLYMPSFARAVGLGEIQGTAAVSLTNASTVIGTIVAGWLTDRYHVTTAVNFCAVGTVVAVFLFWSFAVYTPVLYIFAILYGIFAGGFAATWSGVATVMRGRWPATETGMIIALFAAGKGVGSVISGPLSGAIVDARWFASGRDWAWGSGYGGLIMFSGVTAAVTGTGWCAKKVGWVP
ncbi:major facilitator superfamily domain-containing protein [Elsinoe ampelina]|uniref:Major facilitator superfamily domain-containing protein n=1 Tax=Elsinoe ampelina TaxID=302913 RepID=A0A6A6GCZ9_9PEZI|nr:major facilitator superfamily domain-containing protein [Elsinoe ampelina]